MRKNVRDSLTNTGHRRARAAGYQNNLMENEVAKRLSLARKVRRMVEDGYTTKDIVTKLKVKPQMVYNVRYYINKQKGLASLGKSIPAPTTGIGALPKRRGRPPKAGTGIVAPKRETPITPLPASLSLWERIKRWFRG